MSDEPAPAAKKPISADLTGVPVGDFQLLRLLGQGAMAEVYLAEQRQLKRRVAVKVLKPGLAHDETYLKRFEREAQAAAALVHTNIVQIYEVGRQGDLHYIAEEYVEGQNLREWLSRRGPPDLPHALSIMCQACAALAKAAEHGVVHRDIKPENIMLTRNGEVKIADFGLARFARDEQSSDLTQVGITMGTPLYMSPEQVEGKPLDPRSDIYSLGVTCYHMLAGEPPFNAETALGVAVQHLKSDPKRLELSRGDLPPMLCRIVHKMLAKSPPQRYASAKEVLRELRHVQREHCADQWPEDLPGWETVAMEAPPEGRAAATQQLAGVMKTLALVTPRRWNRGLLVAGLLSAAIVGGVATWLLSGARPLLADADRGRPPIPHQATILRQWYLASQQGTPEAWQSVIDYEPPNPYYARRAEQQLALVYLQRKDYARAMKLFERFAASGEGEESTRAFGLAGEFGVLTLQGSYEAARQVLEDLRPIRGKLQDPQMRTLLEHAVRVKGIGLGAGSRQEWESWLETQFSGEQ